MKRAENQSVWEWALTKLVGTQVDFSADIIVDDILNEDGTKNYNNLYMSKRCLMALCACYYEAARSWETRI